MHLSKYNYSSSCYYLTYWFIDTNVWYPPNFPPKIYFPLPTRWILNITSFFLETCSCTAEHEQFLHRSVPMQCKDSVAELRVWVNLVWNCTARIGFRAKPQLVPIDSTSAIYIASCHLVGIETGTFVSFCNVRLSHSCNWFILLRTAMQLLIEVCGEWFHVIPRARNVSLQGNREKLNLIVTSLVTKYTQNYNIKCPVDATAYFL